MVNDSGTCSSLERQITIGADYSITKRSGSSELSSIQISRSNDNMSVLIQVKEGKSYKTFDIRKSELLTLIEYLQSLTC